MLVGLVGINVYVFFFNHGTAPRDVLNVQSTSKSLDGARRDLLAKDADRARGLLAASASSTAPAETPHAALLPRVKLPPPRPSALSALPVPLTKSPAPVAAPVPVAALEATPVVLAVAEQTPASAPAAAIPFVQAVPPAAPPGAPAPRGAGASSSRGVVQVPWRRPRTTARARWVRTARSRASSATP